MQENLLYHMVKLQEKGEKVDVKIIYVRFHQITHKWCICTTYFFCEGMYDMAVWAHDTILVIHIVGHCCMPAPVILVNILSPSAYEQ